MRVTVAKKSTANTQTSSSSDYYSSKVDDDDDASSSTTTTTILDQISGAARPGRLLCVLGPSGSGKTTFLNALSGRLKDEKNEVRTRRWTREKKRNTPPVQLERRRLSKPRSRDVVLCVFFLGACERTNERLESFSPKNSLSDALSSSSNRTFAQADVTYTGDVLLNGSLVCKSNSKYQNVSYVEQDPKFFSNLTVRETLMLDCQLRDARASKRECEMIVENVLSRYGLLSCADTLVGGDSGGKEVRGISGGEKRRLSIACETAFSFGGSSGSRDNSSADGKWQQQRQQHQLVVCDEPTSGLDAFSADRVVSQLAGLAVERRAVVVCSLHQPRSASWSRAHDVMLLANGGRVAYHGPVSKCIPYFTSIGYECPANYNPAEFLIDLVSIVTDCGVEARENSIERVDDICREWRRQKPFVDRQAIQIELEEKTALERNMFDPKRNHKQRTLMTYQDFHNMMHDHTLTRAETTITQENGAPLSFRDFEKTFAKPLETYVSKQSATAGTNEIETSRFSEEKDGDDDEEEETDGYKTASTTPIKRDTMRDKNDEEEEENCLNEVEKTRKNMHSRSGSAEEVRLEKNNQTAATTKTTNKSGGPLKRLMRHVSTSIRSKVTNTASETSVNTTTTTEFEIYDANGGRNFASFGSTPPSPFKQFQLLVGRSWKQTRREMWVNCVRLIASVGLATAFGSCNFRISKHPSTVKRRVSVLMQSCINNGMLALCRTLNNFPRERLVVRREMRRNVGGYHPGAYFFAKLLVETPIDMLFPVAFGSIVSPMVGLNPAGRKEFVSTLALHAASSAALGLAVSAIAPTSETALAIGPCMMVLSIMLGDATGAFGEVPQALKPLSNLSVVKWSFEGVLASEFENLTFDKNDVETNSSKQLRLRAEKKNREKSHSIVYDATKWATSKLESIGPERGEDVLEEFGLKAKGQARDAAKGQISVFLLNVALAFTALTFKEKQ